MLISPGATQAAGRAISRVTPLARTSLTVACGAIPLVVAATQRTPDLSPTVAFGVMVGGASAGWVVDDAPGEVLVPVAIGRSYRRSLRAIYVLSVIAATFALVVRLTTWLAVDEFSASLRSQLPLAAASAALSIAIAMVAQRRAERSPGAAGVLGAVVTIVSIAGLALRFPGWLPTLTVGASYEHWWYVTGTAGIVAAVAGRDPSRCR